jgi:hypothetical protein
LRLVGAEFQELLDLFEENCCLFVPKISLPSIAKQNDGIYPL